MIRKIGIVLLATAFGCICAPPVEATAQHRNFQYNHMVFKRPVIIGHNTSKPADTCTWLEIGDTNSTRAALLIHPTDTGNIPLAKREFGMLLFRKQDTTIYMWTGNGYRKVKPSP